MTEETRQANRDRAIVLLGEIENEPCRLNKLEIIESIINHIQSLSPIEPEPGTVERKG